MEYEKQQRGYGAAGQPCQTLARTPTDLNNRKADKYAEEQRAHNRDRSPGRKRIAEEHGSDMGNSVVKRRVVIDYIGIIMKVRVHPPIGKIGRLLPNNSLTVIELIGLSHRAKSVSYVVLKVFEQRGQNHNQRKGANNCCCHLQPGAISPTRSDQQPLPLEELRRHSWPGQIGLNQTDGMHVSGFGAKLSFSARLNQLGSAPVTGGLRTMVKMLNSGVGGACSLDPCGQAPG